MAWQRALDSADLWDGDMAGCTVAGQRVLIVKLDGEVAAWLDRCPHLGLPLSEGTLVGRVLTCAGHHFEFDAGSGQGLNPHTVRLTPVPVLIRDGAVFVEAGQERGGKP